MNIEELVRAQQEFFLSGETRSAEYRLNALGLLKTAIKTHRGDIENALYADFRKQPTETYMTEIGIVLDEIRFHEKHLRRWMRDKRVGTPLSQFPGRSYISPEPYGSVLIVSPWNYPVNLCFTPLVGAISGGNCAVLKPSAYAPETSRVIKTIIESVFREEYIAVVEGGRAENTALFEQKFDYIFFTGSAAVGKTVMAAAAKNLTPVTLELGGKSPVIVDRTANLRLAAKRVCFGKVLNAGQTCVEPDYLLIEESVRDEFIRQYRAALRKFFPKNYDKMPVIINEKHFDRVRSLLEGQNAVIGGGTDADNRFVEPTVLVDVSPDSPIMQQEIFGPVLPVITFRDIDFCIDFIRSRPKPLAMYIFSNDVAAQKKLLDCCSFGGGCINDTIVHIATKLSPFGGVGASGMGRYHGKASFDTFTNRRSILKASTVFDLPVRYHPYTRLKARIIELFLK